MTGAVFSRKVSGNGVSSISSLSSVLHHGKDLIYVAEKSRQRQMNLSSSPGSASEQMYVVASVVVLVDSSSMSNVSPSSKHGDDRIGATGESISSFSSSSGTTGTAISRESSSYNSTVATTSPASPNRVFRDASAGKISWSKQPSVNTSLVIVLWASWIFSVWFGMALRTKLSPPTQRYIPQEIPSDCLGYFSVVHRTSHSNGSTPGSSRS